MMVTSFYSTGILINWHDYMHTFYLPILTVAIYTNDGNGLLRKCYKDNMLYMLLTMVYIYQ